MRTSILTLCIPAVALSATSANAQISMGPPQTISVGIEPVDLTLGDFDLDGCCDAVAAEWISGTLTSLRGDGLGNLTSLLSVNAADLQPSTLKAADLDLDGQLDLAVGYWASSVRVFPGNGDGSFAAPSVPWTTGLSPNDLEVADLNLDGLPDIVTANFYGNNVTVLLGAGGGTFVGTPPVVVGMNHLSVSVARIDVGDAPDLLVSSNQPNLLSSLLGNGTGAFPSASNIFTAGEPQQCAALDDFDQDGVTDAVYASPAGTLGLLRGQGNGTFTNVGTPSLGIAPWWILTGDLNRDGRPEIAATDRNGATITLARNLGAFNFSLLSIPAASDPCRIRFADLDQDGLGDIVYCSIADNSISVQLNTTPTSAGIGTYGLGTFGCRGILTMSAGQQPLVGNAGFGLSVTNAPRRSLGITIVGDVPDNSPIDYLGVGLLIPVHLLLSTQLFTFDVVTDAGGFGFTSVPIPNQFSLVGQTFYGCDIFVESAASGDSCSTSPFDLIVSMGVDFTIL